MGLVVVVPPSKILFPRCRSRAASAGGRFDVSFSLVDLSTPPRHARRGSSQKGDGQLGVRVGSDTQSVTRIRAGEVQRSMESGDRDIVYLSMQNLLIKNSCSLNKANCLIWRMF